MSDDDLDLEADLEAALEDTENAHPEIVQPVKSDGGVTGIAGAAPVPPPAGLSDPAACTPRTCDKRPPAAFAQSTRKRARCRNVHAANRVAAMPERCDAPSAGLPYGPIPDLPFDLLLRVFRHLPAADLTQVACVCRTFRHAADDETLWRRLYCSRWKQLHGEANKVMGARFWKCAYMDRDKDTFTELQAPIEEAMRPLYRSMHIAQRSVGIKPGNEPSWAEQTDSWQEQIALFRHMKGLRADAPRPDDASKCRFVQFGDVFVDECTGWVHVCDDSCAETEADDRSAYMACRITGRVHGQVYEQDVTREEAAAICGTEDAEGCSNEPDAQPGWLAQAYLDGYNHNQDDEGDNTLVTPGLLGNKDAVLPSRFRMLQESLSSS